MYVLSRVVRDFFMISSPESIRERSHITCFSFYKHSGFQSETRMCLNFSQIEPQNMLKICLVFWKAEPQYAYKGYAYKKACIRTSD